MLSIIVCVTDDGVPIVIVGLTLPIDTLKVSSPSKLVSPIIVISIQVTESDTGIVILFPLSSL